jgi:hypothetical protein
MWNLSHLDGEGWRVHTVKSIKLAALLLISGAALVLHAILPFWQQPKALRACSVANTICREMAKRE